MLKAMGMKNRPLSHLGRLGRSLLLRMPIESSPVSDSLGNLGRMLSGRDSPSFPRSMCHILPLGPNLWPAWMGTEV